MKRGRTHYRAVAMAAKAGFSLMLGLGVATASGDTGAGAVVACGLIGWLVAAA